MKIRKQSPISGNVNEMDIDVTTEQLKSWADGTLAQDAFPNLSADEREFIMTGITPEEWEETFKE